MKKNIKNKISEAKFEVILLVTLTFILVISFAIGHHFNKGSYYDGPNVKADVENIEGEENNQ